MQTLKTWHLIGLMFHTYFCGCISALEFQPCAYPVKNKPCNMTCHIPNFSQIVSINVNGTTRGLCNLFGCNTNMIPEGGNAVHLLIPSLSYTNDSGQWTCTYQTNRTSPSEVIVFSGFLGVPSLKSQKYSNGVRLTATADCLYPSNPTVVVQYREQDGGYLDLNEQQVDLQTSHLPGDCSFDIENRTTANSEVSGRLAELKGKCVFFRMRFSQYNDSAMPIYSMDSGAFPFEMLSPIPLTIGLLPVLATMLIMSIFLMVLMVVNPKLSILRKIKKRLGDYRKEKLGILIAFVLAALVTGILLSFIMQCDEKNLALILSILAAFLLAVALILTLIFYHIKVESKKDIQDGGAQDGNGSSQNNTGSNTTRTTTERVGSPASTSNVELAAKNKAGVPKGEQSALKQKEINTPLPLPPSGNSQYLTASTNNLPVSRNKLDPIVMENEEPNPSERKKKKRKKKKRKNEKNVDEAGDNED